MNAKAELATLIATTHEFDSSLTPYQSLDAIGEWEPLVCGLEDLLEADPFEEPGDGAYWDGLVDAVMANAAVEVEGEDDSDELAAIFGM